MLTKNQKKLIVECIKGRHGAVDVYLLKMGDIEEITPALQNDISDFLLESRQNPEELGLSVAVYLRAGI